MDKQKLYAFLSDLLTEERKSLFDKVIKYRTRHLTVVLENIFQPHNASAVMRSCDLNGIQDIHVIENNNEYTVNPEVAMGSTKWLNIYRYNESGNNTLSAIDHLRSQGYKIIATTPHKESFTPFNMPLDNKCALLFGTELSGLSDLAIANSDEFLRIPQFGFTESYNISVSAALILFTLTNRLHQSGAHWRLNAEELIDTKLEWARRTIKRSDLIEEQFLKQK
ncbi:MAG: RNA methyltransferase [Chlorobi bacterium]|nr:RNA methyltransferase [Chlorobiota bacterium]